MSNTPLSSNVVTYQPSEAQLAEMAASTRALTITGIEDRKGYAAVHEARMKLKSVRVEIEKTRVAFKADALEYGRRVDSEAKRLTAIIEPAERELESKQKAVDDEKARIAAEVVARKKAKLDERVARLAGLEIIAQPSKLEEMPDEQFEREYETSRVAFVARKAKEKADADEAHRKQRIAEEEIDRKRQAESAARVAQVCPMCGQAVPAKQETKGA